MEDLARHQQLLQRLRDERCGGNAAELARKIGKDPTYINRLFYPAGKKGGKRMGLAMMSAANAAFGLPSGFWDSKDPASADLGPVNSDGQSENMSSHVAKLTSSERITRYVSDVFQSLEEFARDLSKPQRTRFRGLMGDLLSNPEGFAHLDRDQVRALLSDNAYSPDLVETPSELRDPFTNLDEQSVTNSNQQLQRTDGNVPAIPTTKRRPASGAR